MDYEIQKTQASDVNGIKEVLDSSELFPSEYLDGMMAGYLSNTASEEIWLTVKDENGAIVGFAYCVPEKLTDGTYNLLAIAVRKELQGQGIGKLMVEYIEQYLRSHKKRVLIIETSSNARFELTRKFYLKLRYTEIASIKDFWNEGEDKIVFWKKLN